MESIDVLDGKLYVAEQPYAEISGNITGETMSNASYHTDEVCLNGLYIGGDSVYSIKDSAFDMVGYGIDDFAGNGSAIMVNDTAKCEMDNVHVTTHGVIRPCTVVTGNGTLIVRNCILDAKGGEIPKSYVPRIASGMMEPPPGLKLGGNCRTHLSMGNSRAYFYDSKAYGPTPGQALSTDGSNGDLYRRQTTAMWSAKPLATAPTPTTAATTCSTTAGSLLTLMLPLLQADAWVKFSGGTVKSNQYGAMLHGIRGHYTETTECHITGGTWDVGEALFFVKSENVYLKLDGAKVKNRKISGARHCQRR